MNPRITSPLSGSLHCVNDDLLPRTTSRAAGDPSHLPGATP